MECNNASAVYMIEQYQKACRDVLDTAKTELTKYLGPHAIPAIASHFPQPPPHPSPPRLLRTWLARGSPPELLERIKRVESEYKQLAAEMVQMRAVKQYVKWVCGWAHDSPLRDYFAQISYIMQTYYEKRHNAAESFRTSWEALKMKLGRGPSSATCPPGTSLDDWLLAIQEFQQLKL